MKPEDIVRAMVAIIAAIVVLGATLGIAVEPLVAFVVKHGTALVIASIVGAIAAALAKSVTGSLPRALLFGGATTVVLTMAFEVWINVQI